MIPTTRPDPATYPAYYRRYVERVPEGDVLATLAGQLDPTAEVILGFAPEREGHRYGPDKWSVRELVGHMADTERVFALRALWIARGAGADQPGFEEKDWAAASNAADRPLADHVGELRAVRAATLALLRGLDDAAWRREGRANGQPFTPAAVAWIIAGHELHHRAILEERYRPASWGGAGAESGA